MKVRHKNTVVEAERFRLPHSLSEGVTLTFMGFDIQKDDRGIFLTIPTLEGPMRANLDDWIIKGVQGELYPVKPDIFDATYEPVDMDDHVRESASFHVEVREMVGPYPEMPTRAMRAWVVRKDPEGYSVLNAEGYWVRVAGPDCGAFELPCGLVLPVNPQQAVPK
ncbi:MAG TPA: hypothetical protein VD994_18020 [Prosthecobacter sp.]|nr:hypothetical protein [Prosthecobacter sp.]